MILVIKNVLAFCNQGKPYRAPEALITEQLTHCFDSFDGLRTLNTLSQDRDHPDYRVSMY